MVRTSVVADEIDIADDVEYFPAIPHKKITSVEWFESNLKPIFVLSKFCEALEFFLKEIFSDSEIVLK